MGRRMGKIFISYRREDAKYPASRLYEALKPYVGSPKDDIFIDIDSIPAGVDFYDYLDNRVSECDVLLALIGSGWLEAKSSRTGKRRLDDPDDFVRIEIASALNRNIPVVPVLLDGAPIPYADDLPNDLKALTRRNGVPLQLTSFETDVARLVDRLPISLANTGTQLRANATRIKHTKALRLAPLLVILISLAVLILGGWLLFGTQESRARLFGGNPTASEASDSSFNQNTHEASNPDSNLRLSEASSAPETDQSVDTSLTQNDPAEVLKKDIPSEEQALFEKIATETDFTEIAFLTNKYLRSYPDGALTIPVEERRASAKAAIREIQRQLNRIAGERVIDEDGVFGPTTQEFYGAVLQHINVPDSPKITQATLETLRASSRVQVAKSEAGIVYFGIWGSSLSSDAKSMLADVAKQKKYEGKSTLFIAGSANSCEGTRELSLALGARRAYAVAEYLEQFGLDSMTVSYGKDRPLFPNEPDCSPKNRAGYIQ